MDEWFHIHIPKTSGTSLNRMLAQAFDEDFQDHGLTREAPRPLRQIAAAHRTLLQTRRLCPERRLITMLREPVARLRSELEHHYDRRKQPRYQKVGRIVQAMLVEGRLHPDRYLLRHPQLLLHFDNVLVRYLCSTPVKREVTPRHLKEALANLERIDVLMLTERFEDDTQALFARFGRKAELVRTNVRQVQAHIFDELPGELEPLVRLDRALYEAALRLPPPSQSA